MLLRKLEVTDKLRITCYKYLYNENIRLDIFGILILNTLFMTAQNNIEEYLGLQSLFLETRLIRITNINSLYL